VAEANGNYTKYSSFPVSGARAVCTDGASGISGSPYYATDDEQVFCSAQPSWLGESSGQSITGEQESSGYVSTEALAISNCTEHSRK
jgi:hypothetical protein